MRLRDEHLGVALCAVLLLVLGAQPTRGQAAYDPKQDARDFSKSVLVPKGEGISQDKAAPADVPHFSASPPGTSYADDPARMESDAATAKAGDEGYTAMLDSIAKRASFPATEIEATTETGFEVIADPAPYAGVSFSGAQGVCTPIPQAPASPGYYEQSCNTGYAPPGGGTQTRSCDISITVDVTTEQHIFATGLTDPVFAGDPRCTMILGPFPQGRAFTYMGRNMYSTRGPARVYKCIGTTYVDFAPHPVYVTYRTPVLPPTEDASACAALAADTSCTFTAEVCSDSTPETRDVGGTPVTLPCWGKRRDYSCTVAGGPPTLMSDCDQLDAMACTFDREQCLTTDVPCLTMERVYRCPLPPVPPARDTYICPGDVYCIDGSCETLDREANTEFLDAAAALNSIAQASKEFDPANLTIFKGTALACTKLVFGLKNCCVPRGLPLIGGCTGQDSILKDQREKGLCTYVGSWCSSSVLGVCLEKKERHCCYGSKISRLIQEQGRPQLGLAWDDPEDETCAGFTVDQFSMLDLSRMDFSEIYADFEAAAQIPAELDVVTDMQAKISAYYAAKGVP